MTPRQIQNIKAKRLRQGLIISLLASEIEGIAVDLKKDKVRDLAIKVRTIIDSETALAFATLSDMFNAELENLNYNKAQILPVLCKEIYRQGNELNLLNLSLRIGNFAFHNECLELRQLTCGDFISKSIERDLKELIIYFKENCKKV